MWRAMGAGWPRQAKRRGCRIPGRVARRVAATPVGGAGTGTAGTRDEFPLRARMEGNPLSGARQRSRVSAGLFPFGRVAWRSATAGRIGLDLRFVGDLLTAVILHRGNVAGDIRRLAGNYVLIESGAWVAMLAHLRRDSLQVATGDAIRCGQPVGEVGNSGNSVPPHLHFQVMRRRDALTAAIVPFPVRRYERWSGHTWQP